MRRPLLMTPVQIVLSFSLRGTENSKTQESSAGGASLFLPSLDNMARTRRERQISSGVKLLLCVPRGEHDWTSCVASRARGVIQVNRRRPTLRHCETNICQSTPRGCTRWWRGRSLYVINPSMVPC